MCGLRLPAAGLVSGLVANAAAVELAAAAAKVASTTAGRPPAAAPHVAATAAAAAAVEVGVVIEVAAVAAVAVGVATIMAAGVATSGLAAVTSRYAPRSGGDIAGRGTALVGNKKCTHLIPCDCVLTCLQVPLRYEPKPP